MKLKQQALAVLSTLFLAVSVLADSLLTSADFSKAYLDQPIVAAAKQVKGVINERLM